RTRGLQRKACPAPQAYRALLRRLSDDQKRAAGRLAVETHLGFWPASDADCGLWFPASRERKKTGRASDAYVPGLCLRPAPATQRTANAAADRQRSPFEGFGSRRSASA